jgi:hypothetical protein
MSTLLPILRRSAIQSAKACLHRYNQIWNLGVPDDNEHSLRGIGFHAAAYQYVQALWDAKLPSDQELSKQAFVAGIALAKTPAPIIPEVQAIYRRWAEMFQLDLAAFLGAEEKQQTDTDHVFTADLVYARPHELEVVDFKTYFQPLTETQLREDWQTRWYMFASRKVWPNFKQYRFTHSYVRLGLTVSVVIEESDLDGFADEVAAIAGVIQEAKRTNDWPATPGDECRFCQLRCPVADHMELTPKRLISMDSARKAAGLIMAGEQLIKAAKGALKAYCATEGPVDVGGVEWDNRPVDQRSYPVAEVLKVLQERGRMGAFESEDLTLSHSSLAKLFKAYPQLEADLAPALRSKTTYRFSPKRTAPEVKEITDWSEQDQG